MRKGRKQVAESLQLASCYSEAAALIRGAERLISAARTAASRGVDPAVIVPAVVDSERELRAAARRKVAS